ncbi:hypothetical protein HAX54_009875, partial [Datura stramonium]|nr:hypothetical protein [Datura stramonium]
ALTQSLENDSLKWLKLERSKREQRAGPSYGTLAESGHWQSGKPITPFCDICNREHFGNYRRSLTTYFSYGSDDHLIQDCPHME